MFTYLIAALTARAEAYRMMFEMPQGLAKVANPEAEQLLRESKQQRPRLTVAGQRG
ncbi:MAG: hypothetical protein Kilf2KO_08130 [Rhodospirillales bacterium]